MKRFILSFPLSVLVFGVIAPLFTSTVSATSPLSNDQIVYTVNQQDLYKINTDGTGKTELMDHSVTSYSSTPQISPDRTKIYYAGGSSSHEHTINADGTSNTDLGYAPGYALSPDGSKVAGATYMTWRYGITSHYYGAIRISNADGTGSVDIHPSLPGDMVDPTWSSDGNSIVFVWKEATPSWTQDTCYNWIAKINIDGTGFTKLTPDNTGQSLGTCADIQQPAVNPINGKIAYTSNNNSIIVMKPDGSSSSTLYSATGTAATEYPTWSPDGSQLAIAYRGTSGSIWYVGILDASSGSLVGTIGATTGGASINSMDWASGLSLSNNQIVYSVSSQDLYKINADGTGKTELMDHSITAYSNIPQISRDRTKVYYTGGASGDVYTVNSDGTSNTDLGYSIGALSLSPDGSKMAGTTYATWRYGITSHYYSAIRIANADGTGSVDIHPSLPGDVADPTWSPDGNSIIFVWREATSSWTEDTCYTWIAKINTDGTGFTKLTSDNTGQPLGTCADIQSPAANPINGKVAYSSNNSSIIVMNSDGSSSSTLYSATGTAATQHPTWSPDGTQLAISYRGTSGSTYYVGILDASSGSLLSTIGATTGGASINWMDWASQ